jgi:methionyl-tRNA formyltransferase
MEQLQAWSPEVIVVAAFGQILRPAVLDLPPGGCINVHASLLPRWRGAAPIQAAILHGDEQSGVTIMLMDPGVDTGPKLSQRSTPILPEDSAGTLSQRLAQLGAELLIDTLPGYLSGETKRVPQDESEATYAPLLKKSDGELDFNQPATTLTRQVRAFNPWPGTFITWKSGRLKIHRASGIPASELETRLAPGEKTVYRKSPAIGTCEGLLVLDEVQPAGKKAMPGRVFLQGARNWQDVS